MNEDVLDFVKKRNRQRSIAISDNLIKEIEEITKGCISVSGFIRMAVRNEIDRYKKIKNLK
jgi:metal-responsive CopG/Arc/MetJ family transcriptional regulator